MMKKILIAIAAMALVIQTGSAFAQQSAAPTPAPNPTAAATAVPQVTGGVATGFTGATVTLAPTSVSTGALSLYSNSALTTTVLDIKTTAGNLYGWNVYNPGTGACYLQCFAKAASAVTLGTTVADFTIGGATLTQNSLVSDVPLWAFNTRLSCAATTTITGSSACNVAQVVNLFFK
jgi:hypothetical protein